jgi:ribonuclease HI
VIIAYTDGGARGNPGPAGYGVRIESEDGSVLAELSGSIGVSTNNVAEYHGLIAALEWAVAHKHPRVRVRSDSELLVRQMRGEYKVKHPNLQPLYRDATRLVSKLQSVVFEHVRRELNREADRLANEAMDQSGPKVSGA